MIMCFEFVFE